MVVFHEGDNVRAKFMATKMGPFGTKFLPGVISKVHPDPGKKDDKYRYDINYENGKFEANVKAQFVKEPLAEAAGAVAPTPRPELAPEAKQLEPKSVHKEVKPVAPQATPAAKPEPKSAQKASAGPTDDSGCKRESKLSKASPDGSDAEFAAKPSKAAASAAASGRPEAAASASSNKRVRKQVDYNAAEESSEDESEEEEAAASKSARASASKNKASKPKKVVAESESEEYEEPSSEGSGDEESESESEPESEPEKVPKKKPAKAAPKPAAPKPAAKKAVVPARKTKKPASPAADSASEEGSDEEEQEEEEDDDDAFDEEKAPVKKAAKAHGATRPKGGSSYDKSKWSEEEIAELAVLTKPQEMFDDMVARAEARASTKGSALEGHSLAALAQRLDGRKLRVATM